jgi:beta-lactamase class A
MTISRRVVMTGALLLPTAARAAESDFSQLERLAGVRVGVAALDTGSGKRIGWRAGERFVMCSTFKLSLAAAILAKADKGGETLDRQVPIGPDVPIGVSPATRRNVGHNMTIAELCEAAVVYSDNGAANTLLAALGGPKILTAYWRSLGDGITRLDDIEPKLNIPDGERNTTTPAAMLGNLKFLLVGNAVSPASRDRLLNWMRASTTGVSRLRAGLPALWQWGDKTGTSAERYGLVNDIGIATPPGRKPILIAAYTERGSEGALRVIGESLARAFA